MFVKASAKVLCIYDVTEGKADAGQMVPVAVCHHQHHRCDSVLRVLGDATCVQGRISIVEKFVHNLKLLLAFIFLFVIVYYQ